MPRVEGDFYIKKIRIFEVFIKKLDRHISLAYSDLMIERIAILMTSLMLLGRM